MSSARPASPQVGALRVTSLSLALILSFFAGYCFLRFTAQEGLSALDIVRTALVVVAGFWLIWGAVPAVLGALVPRQGPGESAQSPPPTGRTVVLVPIYNEDAEETFSRVAAMNRGLVRRGVADAFDFAILSDTNEMDIAAMEAVAYDKLMYEPAAIGRIFYRRRETNTAKKAGNIEDFIKRSGGAYDYALVLDADSLMEPETILAMVARMDADPDLGLLQSVPRIIGAQTLFGRAMQFSSCYLSPVFARGMALFQGREGPYWGHNAIIRLSAFAACCGLPVLSGKPPAGGHILSHDYVEAALLSRGGWRVAVDSSLKGSYEEGPDNLIEYAKRDRRWCQGNLQHRRLLLVPGLKAWSRFTLLQGIMAYLASPLWLALLVTSVVAASLPEQRYLFSHPPLDQAPVWTLGVAVAALLTVPKLLIVVRGALDGENARFGGSARAMLSILSEIFVSTLIAPVMLLLQSRAIFQILFGLDGGWPATCRGSSRLSLRTAFLATWWIVLAGAATFAAVWYLALGSLLWVLPATLPSVLAPLVVWASAIPGKSKRTPLVFLTDAEWTEPKVRRDQLAILAQWRGLPNASTASGSRLKDERHDAAFA